MAYGQGQEDSSTQALEVFGEKQGEIDVEQLLQMVTLLMPLIMQQGAAPGMVAPQGMVQPQGLTPQASGLSPWEAERLKRIRAPRPAARPMQGPPMPPARPMQGPPAPLRHQLGAPAGHSWPGLPRREADPKMPSMIPRVPQVRPQGGGGGNMLQMLMQMMVGGR